MVSSEAVVARNPDVILGTNSHMEGLSAEKITARPGWAETCLPRRPAAS